ncbi:TB2/DP1, HVA22 family-domain-containing protein [Fomitopsis serialis]|uniref:TB2/DP1, HVA22 family-domain-containing protein n=1 Tax=Fomitopsis serialis TaxID=139415 RepID=UPI00200775A7|nr:TB2/DP1, HVA22 family-domain-containing protein [Neoantrodia serialis]KAH9937266.1 TB2/DP1, HVA22 family-domain-containing protein [Neoantrodia serialis]
MLYSAWFSLLLPAYGTWKSLAHRPVSEPELERWAMYWSVMGAFVAFEHVAEWFISWLPFYWEIKILVLFYLSLPQTQGSTWVYHTFVHPYLSINEANIDASIAAAKANIVAFVQSRFATLWQRFVETAMKAASTAGAQPQGEPGAPPTSPIDMAKGLWSTYGPALMGSLQAPAGAANQHQRPVPPHAYSSASIYSQSSVSSESSPASSSHSSEPPAYPEPYKV